MDNDIEEIFISKLPENVKYRLKFNEYVRRWEMFIKNIKPMKGVGCALCGVPIGECGSDDRIYFCADDKIFICRSCVIEKHRRPKRDESLINDKSIVFHEDKLVDVIWEDDGLSNTGEEE